MLSIIGIKKTIKQHTADMDITDSHFQFHITSIAFVNMECKENEVNDADIDDRFPADIEKAANRATLTFINK
jgi:hypothetical protein